MAYKTNKEKVKELMDYNIIPALKNKTINGEGLDYSKLVNEISKRTGASINIIGEIINNYKEMGMVKEVRLILSSDEQVEDYFKELGKIKKEVQESV